MEFNNHVEIWNENWKNWGSSCQRMYYYLFSSCALIKYLQIQMKSNHFFISFFTSRTMGTACCKCCEHGEENKESFQSLVPHVSEEETNFQYGTISQSATFQHEFQGKRILNSPIRLCGQATFPVLAACVGNINPTWHWYIIQINHSFPVSAMARFRSCSH